MAGINAGRSCLQLSPYQLHRGNSFIGVLIDDIISMGVLEPYRIFTARSEFRLTLRAENADFRLTPDAIQMGLVDQTKKEVFLKKFELKNKGISYLENTKMKISDWKAMGI